MTGARPWHRRLTRWIRYDGPRPHARVRWGKHCARGSTHRDVLLVGGSELMWEYLDDFRRVFDGDPRIRFWASTPFAGKYAQRAPGEAQQRGLPFVSRAAARKRWWDLVVFPDHGAAHRYAPFVPKLKIQHALSDGKRTRGRTVRYDPLRVLRKRGGALYDMIFDASEERRVRVEQEVPALRGRVRVVGDLRADALLALRGDRERIRRELGLSATDQVVVLCSTWGPGCLVERFGPALLDEARSITRIDGTQFILSAHPHAWTDPRHGWLRATAGDSVRVIGPGEDWAPAFVAADALVADHTSLLAMFALLHKPIACVPVSPDQLDPDTTLGRLHALAPRLETPAALGPWIRDILPSYPAEPLRALAHAINACPGRAETNFRMATLGLLRLPPPA